jgi:hypothetical protein
MSRIEPRGDTDRGALREWIKINFPDSPATQPARDAPAICAGLRCTLV